MTIRGPIDLTQEIPQGCICDRECWGGFLGFCKENPDSCPVSWKCAKHGALHLFKPGSRETQADGSG